MTRRGSRIPVNFRTEPRQLRPMPKGARAESIREKLARIDRSRLARESAKLDPAFEKAMAEEGVSGGLVGWPEY